MAAGAADDAASGVGAFLRCDAGVHMMQYLRRRLLRLLHTFCLLRKLSCHVQACEHSLRGKCLSSALTEAYAEPIGMQKLRSLAVLVPQ